MKKQVKPLNSAIDFNIHTEIEGDDIHTQVDMVMNEVIVNTQAQILRTKDTQIRDALIKMGWTPPVSIVLPFAR